MNIAIISDIHDNIVNLEKFLNWCKNEKVEKIICCGDVTNSETLNILARGFEKEIYLVGGNIELYDEEALKQYPNIIYYGKIGVVEIDKYKIGICHEPFFINKILEKEDVDFIFYGHTHKPWIDTPASSAQEDKEIKIVNPGTLGGVFQKATFAVLEKNIKLVLLENI